MKGGRDEKGEKERDVRGTEEKIEKGKLVWEKGKRVREKGKGRRNEKRRKGEESEKEVGRK